MAENTENKYLNKVPPHDNDAEQAVLACMLFDNEGARIGTILLHYFWQCAIMLCRKE